MRRVPSEGTEQASWPRFIGCVATGLVLVAASLLLTLGVTAPAASILVVESSRRATRAPGAVSALALAISWTACVLGLYWWIAWAVIVWRGDRLGGIKASVLGSAALVIGGLVLAAATWAMLRLIAGARARRGANLQRSSA